MATTPTTNQGLRQSFYTLNEENGSFEKVEIVRRPVANVDDQIRALAADQPTFIPRLCATGRHPVHLCSTASLLAMCVRLPHIRLSTWWRIVNPTDRRCKAYITPIFRAIGQEFQAAPLWTPLSNMALFFMSCFVLSGGRYAYSRSNLAVICTDKKHPGVYKLPLPNIHANAKLCLGPDSSGIHPDANTPLSVVFDKSLDVFQTAPWNTDLINENDPATIDRFFRFAADDNRTQIPAATAEDWVSTWARVNNTDFGNIPFHDLL